ncbi:MBL fold metallo-hydrolase [Pontixanthobacter aestiaquae]|uniref:MBL fold metallo-hydrolase n=1 Tax=Pontixanthobacter aestiaquae TaxID=1509367 RepID=A0A844Z3B6_9SPHN|nr:MBL fold metallo-hydrolase [Pontixanthobacter aestiaquae]MDN3647193.1 MBL fold metallo-hydrolase [Pontixanthobacter aestiaquae]MXO81832.1 MBL fold metallo-hydrolase [Pontixanthobacter aestiaquae]
MIEGRIRYFDGDANMYFAAKRNSGYREAKRAQARFRRDFTTPLKASPAGGAPVLAELPWGTKVTMSAPITRDPFTEVEFDGTTGFVDTRHLVEIAYVDRPLEVTDPKTLSATLKRAGDKDDADLLWGDMVQILDRAGGTARARARGLIGTISADKLTHKALLECYFIDVGQGDGVLVRYPDGSHMLIDGGLPRSKQQTGKNAADFVDWKFFRDYGDWRIDLDWMIASHSDEDHYGGLKDLVEKDRAAREELDTLEVAIGTFGHPGLSRFPAAVEKEGLGPKGMLGGTSVFTRLLGDRSDAQALVDGTGADGLKLSGPWRSFISRVLTNDAATEFELIALPKSEAEQGNAPVLAQAGDCTIRVLGPATLDDGGTPVLPDLTPTANKKSINTNGHSVCLRLDYGAARILMTGDLNTASMHWLTEAFGGDLSGWKCDVAKACHHGSDDISYKFLQAINAAATVISSGDNEGHAHPRPEVVAASAISGRVELTPSQDKVVTPLIYMTEIERSVMLSEVNRIELSNVGDDRQDFTILAKPVVEFSDSEFFTDRDWKRLEDMANPDTIKEFRQETVTARKQALEAAEEGEMRNFTRSRLYGSRPKGVVGRNYDRRSLRGLRIMEQNVYGLVNVRTDGEWIMCASKRDNGERWTIHAFKAGFGGG